MIICPNPYFSPLEFTLYIHIFRQNEVITPCHLTAKYKLSILVDLIASLEMEEQNPPVDRRASLQGRRSPVRQSAHSQDTFRSHPASVYISILICNYHRGVRKSSIRWHFCFDCRKFYRYLGYVIFVWEKYWLIKLISDSLCFFIDINNFLSPRFCVGHRRLWKRVTRMRNESSVVVPTANGTTLWAASVLALGSCAFLISTSSLPHVSQRQNRLFLRWVPVTHI